MSFSLQPHHAFEPLRAAIHAAYRCDEHARVRALIEAARLSTSAIGRIQTRARDLVQTIRHQRSTAGGVDALMHEFSLSSREGIALMCLAEALDNRIEWGVWGGMTERERRALLKRHPEVDSWAEYLADQEEELPERSA